MAKPAGYAAPTTAAGIARPFGAMGLVVPGRFSLIPLLPSQVPPMYEGEETPEQKAARELEEKHEKEIGGRLKKQEDKLVKQFQKELKEAVETANTALLEKIQALLPEKKDQKETPPGGGGGGGGDKDLDNHPVIAGLRKQLEDEKKERIKSKELLDAEKAKARMESRDRALREAIDKQLTALGVVEDGKRSLSRCAKELIREGVAKWSGDEDDAPIVFVDDKGEQIDLETGIAGFMKTEIGKSYLPPRGAAGSGDGPFGRNPGNRQQGPKLSDEELVQGLFGAR